jgi:ParD-like antitoxin of type II ParDE toxin-antitoxin system
MSSPVKVSDTLLALAKKEAESTHRSATAQIEHWATLGRAVEIMAAYRDVLALKRAGAVLPMPAYVSRDALHDRLTGLVHDAHRESVKGRIRAAATPLYATDPEHPGSIVEVQADDTRTVGRLLGRRFVPARRAPGRIVAARRKSTRRAR